MIYDGAGLSSPSARKKVPAVRWCTEKILPSPHPKGWGWGGWTFPRAKNCSTVRNFCTSVRTGAALSSPSATQKKTNHGYFNLAGHNSGSAMDQHILLFAHAYTPSNAEGIPLGITQSVERTPMDLRELIPIQTHIEDSFPQLVQAKGYDHNYVIDGSIGQLRPAAMAMSDLTGISMRVDSTMPGIHFYTANYVSVDHPGKGGCTYGPRHGFCLETQFYPDAIHHESFPSLILEAGKVYNHSTVFSFNNI